VAAHQQRTFLHGGDARGYIILLLNDLVSERKERAAMLEQQVVEYLRLP
jgi:hypothetical protein